MLIRLTKRRGVTSASVLTLLYLLCIFAPAFADGSRAANCLINDNQVIAAHAHDEGSSHHDFDDDTPTKEADDTHKARAGFCCGLFCFVAVMGEPHDFVNLPVHNSSILPPVEQRIGGRGPDRINRPPITLVSL